jgi:hypothetical protein
MSEREKLRAAIAAAIKDATSIGGAPNKPCVIGHLSAADAALSALEAAGVRLVPQFSTFEMESAVKDEHIPHRDIYGHLPLDRRREGASDIYRAMLAASPYAKEPSNG